MVLWWTSYMLYNVQQWWTEPRCFSAQWKIRLLYVITHASLRVSRYWSPNWSERSYKLWYIVSIRNTQFRGRILFQADVWIVPWDVHLQFPSESRSPLLLLNLTGTRCIQRGWVFLVNGFTQTTELTLTGRLYLRDNRLSRNAGRWRHFAQNVSS